MVQVGFDFKNQKYYNYDHLEVLKNTDGTFMIKDNEANEDVSMTPFWTFDKKYSIHMLKSNNVKWNIIEWKYKSKELWFVYSEVKNKILYVVSAEDACLYDYNDNNLFICTKSFSIGQDESTGVIVLNKDGDDVLRLKYGDNFFCASLMSLTDMMPDKRFPDGSYQIEWVDINNTPKMVESIISHDIYTNILSSKMEMMIPSKIKRMIFNVNLRNEIDIPHTNKGTIIIPCGNDYDLCSGFEHYTDISYAINSRGEVGITPVLLNLKNYSIEYPIKNVDGKPLYFDMHSIIQYGSGDDDFYFVLESKHFYGNFMKYISLYDSNMKLKYDNIDRIKLINWYEGGNYGVYMYEDDKYPYILGNNGEFLFDSQLINVNECERANYEYIPPLHLKNGKYVFCYFGEFCQIMPRELMKNKIYADKYARIEDVVGMFNVSDGINEVGIISIDGKYNLIDIGHCPSYYYGKVFDFNRYDVLLNVWCDDIKIGNNEVIFCKKNNTWYIVGNDLVMTAVVPKDTISLPSSRYVVHLVDGRWAFVDYLCKDSNDCIKNEYIFDEIEDCYSIFSIVTNNKKQTYVATQCDLVYDEMFLFMDDNDNPIWFDECEPYEEDDNNYIFNVVENGKTKTLTIKK